MWKHGGKDRGGLAFFEKLAQKSYLQHLSGKGVGNLLCIRELYKLMPVASTFTIKCARFLVAGTRKATRYQGNMGNLFLAWRKEPGYGHKSLDEDLNIKSEIGNPHGYILRALWKAYGWPSQTERKSLDNEGLSTRSLVKIQSTPRSKDVDTVTAINSSTYCFFTCNNIIIKSLVQTFRKPQRMYFSKSEWNSVAGCFSHLIYRGMQSCSGCSVKRWRPSNPW